MFQIITRFTLHCSPSATLHPPDKISKAYSDTDESNLTSMISPDDKLKKYPSSNNSSSLSVLNTHSFVTKMPKNAGTFFTNNKYNCVQ